MRAISYPFTITPNGKIEATSSLTKIITDRILTLLSTIVTSRYMVPSYGLNLAKGIYENGNDFMDGMDSAIREAMSVWFPDIDIETILFDLPDENGIGKISLTVQIPSGEIVNLSMSTSNLSQDGLTNAAIGVNNG